MADEQTSTSPREAAARARHTPGHRVFAGAALLALLGVTILFAENLSQTGANKDLTSQVRVITTSQNEAAAAASKLAEQVRELGGTPVTAAPPPVQAPDVASGKDSTPTQAQIDGSVDRYLAAHPPAGATPAMVAAQVAAYLVANPPAAGQNATPAQIATAVSTYVDAHPDEFRGPAGADATDAQVSATVDAYCSAHNDCAGPPGADGKQGDQGVGMTDLQFVRDAAGDCEVVVTLHDPATGTDTTVTHPAGDAACPAATAPTTTDPTTTTNPPLLGG